MYATLYKGCILSDNYDEVIDTASPGSGQASPLEAYLATLEHYTIEFDTVFPAYSGSINFEYNDATGAGNITEYNYMKIYDSDVTIYAFIRAAQIVNGLAVISYEFDLWSTFSPRMILRDSIRAATRFPLVSRPYSLPVSHVSNEAPVFEPSYPNTIRTPGTCKCVIIYQIYTLGQQGEVTHREGYTAALYYKKHSESAYVNAGDYRNIEDVVTALISASSDHQISYQESAVEVYQYEITAAYAIPNTLYVEEQGSAIYHSVVQAGIYDVRLYNLNYSDAWLADTVTIPADAKILGFGVPSNIVPVTFNGAAHIAKIITKATKYTFLMFLHLDGGTWEFQRNFEIDLPLTAANAAETQQARINKSLRDGQFAASYWQSALSIVGAVGTAAASVKTGNVAGTLAGVGSIGSGVFSIVNTAAQQNAANAAVYTSNSGTRCTSAAGLNSWYGYGTLAIDEAVNALEVTEAINELGYSVNYRQRSIYVDTATPAERASRGYDVVRFSFARVAGDLPEELKAAFRGILTNGFKMWYTIPF